MSEDLDRLAAEPLDAEDLLALGTLRAIFAASDPVPPGLAERSKFAMTVAALEAEVAQITAAGVEAAGVRTTTYDRAQTVTFSSAHLSAMITIELVDGGRARISGWVSADGPTGVELRERSRTQTTETDADGRFRFSQVERGLVHLLLRRLDLPDSRPVITPAIEI
ncbi:hypothetical protein GCM10025782_06180 [Pedococcus ginsenosidimutans]|uniref:Carboxypeptidase regulatory-like domain-containing protein n=1 Tax=Pedococcus ginsenosidimutans TaxID=490570 RepID=A0ABP8XQZ2_9MICO